MKKHRNTFKFKIFFPLLTILTLLLLSFIYIFNSSQHRQLETDFKELTDIAENSLQHHQIEDASLMSGIIETFQHNKVADNAWLKQDRKALYKNVYPLFNKIRSKWNITHFYFYKTDKTCFLRVHNPKKFGDYVPKHTLRQATEKKIPVHGIELGKFATFVLRVVHPWKINGKLVGYIELGKDEDKMHAASKEILGIDSIITIKKELINRERWEEGQKLMDHSTDWDQFPDNIVMSNTVDVPSRLESHGDQVFRLTVGDQQYFQKDIPLIDASGKETGRIFWLLNITQKESSLRLLTLYTVLGFLLLSGFLSVLIYFIVKRVEDQILVSSLELEKSEKRYRTIVNDMSDGLGILSPNGQIEFVNPAMCKMMEYSQEELFGSNVSILLDKENLARLKSHAIDISKKREVSTSELTFKTKSGKSIVTKISSSAIFDNNGNFVGSFGIITNISAMIKITEQLLSAKEAAEESYRLQSNFLSNVSHEIRTPLNAIIGFAEIILDEKPQKEVTEYTKKLLKEAGFLLTLIDDLLDQAKIEAGSLELEIKDTDLNTLLHNIYDKFILKTKEKKLLFELLVDDDVPRYIKTDPVRTTQVISNLISNSIKFTQTGFIKLAVEQVRQFNDNRVKLKFSVIDTGIGIPKNKQKVIFNRFQQVDASTSRKYGGTGLGISITQEILDLFGAELIIVSEEKHGSIFSFEIIFDLGAQQETQPIEHLESLPDLANSFQFANKNVLLAEDNETNMEIITMHLRAMGLDVTVARDGLEAITACENQDFDLIILDIQMPVLDGIGAAVRIRNMRNANSETKIIALTASKESAIRNITKVATIDEILTKPVRKAEFKKKIYEVISGKTLENGVPLATTASSQNDPPIDYAKALEEFSGNSKLLNDVIEKFLLQLKKQVQNLEKYILDKDSIKIKKEAHKLYGAASNLRAPALSLAASKLEESADRNKWNQIEELVDSIKIEFDRFNKYRDEDL